MATLSLKVDVDTLRGTQEGVPRLLELFARQDLRATFLFSLGPDHTGRAIRRVFRPGFFAKVQRTSVLEHYGLKTLLYGTLLPGPDIGRRCADVLRASQTAGHEVGIHTWDHVAWQDHVRQRDERWTRDQMQRAYDRFTEVFGAPPATHGAAGWQMNPWALKQLDDWGIRYASDGRIGTGALGAQGPYRVGLDGDILQCIQIPTTLPTLDELIGIDGLDEFGAAERILGLSSGAQRDHIFTLHAELEGAKLQPAFEKLLAGWRAQGYQFATLGDYYRRLEPRNLPVRQVAFGSVAGRSGDLLVAGAALPG
jgi:peptidoglycan/xylan/chitin deacetylase (PgdA/CDA1 family)